MAAALTGSASDAPASVGAPPLRDVAVAAVCAVATVAALLISEEPGARSPDALAGVLLVAASAPLVFRRRWPVAVAGVTSLLALVYFAMSYPGGPSTLPVLVALYAVGVAGYRWWSLLVVVVFAGGGVAFRSLVEHDPPLSVLIDAALIVVVALFADVVYSRRTLRVEVRERLRAAASEREKEAQRRVVEERLRIARDLHDVIAHTITAVTVQAGVAADVMLDRPEQALAALGQVRSASTEAVEELRAAVSALRDDPDGTGRSVLSLDGVPTLAKRVAGDRLHLVVEIDDHLGSSVPPPVQVAAYRIVQEALTNVLRHAGARRAWVTVTSRAGELVVRVEDDGRGPGGDDRDGYGLIGMRERAAAVGGSLRTGLSSVGGFRVEALLPTEAVVR